MRITTVILLINVIILFIVIPVTGGIMFYFARNAVQNSITNEQTKLSQQAMDKLDRSLFERYNQIQVVSKEEIFEDLLTGRTTSDKKSSESASQKLNKLALLTGPWEVLQLIDSKGKVVLSTEGEEQNAHEVKGVFQDEVINKALVGEQAYSDAFWDDALKRPTILFAAPIRDEKGPTQRIIGIALGHLSWQVVLEILQGMQGVTVDLYKADGVKIGENNFRIPTQLQHSHLITKSNIQKALVQDTFTNTYTHPERNEQVLATFTKENGYLSYKGNNWVLGISVPTSKAVAPSERAAALTIFVSFVPLTIIFAVIIYLFILRLLRPIQLLTQMTKQIAAGDFNQQVPIISTKDEIGQLAIAFNNMTVKLREFYQNLEQKVQEKTVQLNEKVEELEKEKMFLDEQKEILDTVVHNMPIGIALSDSTGKSLLVNEAGIALVGRGIDPNARNETIAEIYQLFRSDGALYPMEELPNVIAMREGIVVTKDDMVVHRPDGAKIAIRVTCAPIKKEQGQIAFVVTVFEDITKEKEIDRMKTEFISLASHQLRTPLSAIKWFSEMLLGGDAGELTAEQKDFAKNITDSTQRMIALVNSLLNISRIESGRIIVDPQPTDLKELVQGVVTDLKAKIAEREQNLIISVHEGLPKISIDPRLIRQVYMNLLTNAIKYTPKGGEISVFISRKDNEIISQVSDNGYGIPVQQQKRVFEKFFRAENIVKIETDGTGLGLYLIKSIVESSQGKIWFQSEEAKGTTFWFSLPVAGTPAKKGEVTLDN